MNEEKVDTRMNPCPFCGVRPHIVRQECLTNGYNSYVLYHPVKADCILSDVKSDRLYRDEESVIKSWNRRIWREHREPTE